MRGIRVGATPRQLWGYGLAVLILIALLVILGDEAARHFRRVEDWIMRIGPWGPIVFAIGVALLTALFIPDTVLALAAGAIFGLQIGTLVIACGGVLSAALSYLVARRWLAEYVERTLARRPTLRAVRAAVRKDQLRIQFLLRLTPLSPALVSLMLGATGVRFGGFLLACCAALPIWFTQVYFGYAGRRVAEQMGSHGEGRWLDEGLVALGLVALIAVVVFVSRRAQRAIAEASTEAESSGERQATP